KEIKKKYVVLFISLSSCWYPLFGIYPFGHISVDLPDILQTTYMKLQLVVLFAFDVKTCFVCKHSVENLKSLIIHFRIFHSLHSFSSYKCIEDSCNQSFQNLNSFKKHMNTKHLNNLLINEIETPKYISNSPLNFTNLPTYKISTDNELFCNTSQSLPNNSSIPFDLNATSNLVYKSAVEFTLSLHNNNSFTRRDILNIQKNIAENIIKPIATILDNIVKINIKDPMLLLEFSNVTSVISNPFKLCNYEQSGDVVYDEKITKGIPLPLQFQFKTYFEHNNNLIKILNQIKELNKPNNVLSHFIQGKLWKQKITNFQNKTINNPLGSHATIQLISAIYYSFPLLWNSFKLSYIFLAATRRFINLNI
ncbi:C2H2-type domain-containing protein, partial [Aphis craccivora]